MGLAETKTYQTADVAQCYKLYIQWCAKNEQIIHIKKLSIFQSVLILHQQFWNALRHAIISAIHSDYILGWWWTYLYFGRTCHEHRWTYKWNLYSALLYKPSSLVFSQVVLTNKEWKLLLARGFYYCSNNYYSHILRNCLDTKWGGRHCHWLFRWLGTHSSEEE